MSEKDLPRNIARLFDRVAQPIYFVDRQWHIRYCNQACLEWLGCTKDAIVDRRCAFHSGVNLDPGDALAAGLCPPPGVMEATETLGIVMCLQPTGELKRRRTRFLTLSTRSGPLGVLAIVSEEDLSDSLTAEALADSLTDAQHFLSSRKNKLALQLHEELRQSWKTDFSKGRLPLLVGSSPAVRRLRHQLLALAKVNCNVCILEPPGGNGVSFAKAIFYGAEPDPQQCLIPLPCEELDPEILRMTIHAFDSAPPPPPESLHTLLLENVDRLPPVSQEVLRDIVTSQSRSYRILATTNKQLDELVKKGEFLPELVHVIAHFTVVIPTLSERREDIPLLAQAILEDCNANESKQVLGFSKDVLELFAQHDWPGNFDELTWVVNRAYQETQKSIIDVEAIPRELRWSMQRKTRSLRDPETISLPEFLGQVEKELLIRALKRARGNKTRAAKMLGLSRPRFYRRLLQYKLIRPDELPEQ
ncbi:MAG: helix-turn-helix domain-containing protein [Thermogutta sp.]